MKLKSVLLIIVLAMITAPLQRAMASESRPAANQYGLNYYGSVVLNGSIEPIYGPSPSPTDGIYEYLNTKEPVCWIDVYPYDSKTSTVHYEGRELPVYRVDFGVNPRISN